MQMSEKAPLFEAPSEWTQASSLRKAVRRVLALGPGPRRRPGHGLRRMLLAALLGGGAVGLCAGAASAQAPYQQKILTGFSSFDTGSLSSPELADLDLDGDLDLVAGSLDGRLRYFVNTRSASSPAFVEATGVYSPFSGIDVGEDSKSELADLDGDGDRDLVVGEGGGGLRYYRNTGNAAVPAFLERTGTNNPFAGIDTGFYSSPALVNLDGDGDLDAVVGSNEGDLRYFRNTGTSSSPAFAEITGSANPFAGIDVGARSAPEPVDLDGDGDRDLAVGEGAGSVFYFQNTGSSSAPAFLEQSGGGNPVAGLAVPLRSRPVLADFDGDGDFDAVVGELSGEFFYFKNTGSSNSPLFAAQTAAANPFAGIDFGDTFCRPEPGDLDGDGDLDVLVSDYYGNLRYFANTGSSQAPALAERTGTANPFASFALGTYVSPELIDFDGDGDLDAVVGEYEGNLNYLANTGSSSAPAFVQRTGSANPFGAIDVGLVSFPVLVDLDSDGDLDLVIGENEGYLSYFANMGSSSAPLFAELTGTASPFDSVDPLIGNSSPAWADLDGDGDLDVIAGSIEGDFHFYLNTGDASFPAFVELTGSTNPFAGIDVGYTSNPALADLDGDGDLDLLTGEVDGHVVYFASSARALFEDGFESGDTSGWSITLP